MIFRNYIKNLKSEIRNQRFLKFWEELNFSKNLKLKIFKTSRKIKLIFQKYRKSKIKDFLELKPGKAWKNYKITKKSKSKDFQNFSKTLKKFFGNYEELKDLLLISGKIRFDFRKYPESKIFENL